MAARNPVIDLADTFAGIRSHPYAVTGVIVVVLVLMGASKIASRLVLAAMILVVVSLIVIRWTD